MHPFTSLLRQVYERTKFPGLPVHIDVDFSPVSEVITNDANRKQTLMREAVSIAYSKFIKFAIQQVLVSLYLD